MRLAPDRPVPRFHLAIALTLTALGLAPGAAHVMEMPVKLGYSAPLYADVTSTLYRWYGIAGGLVQVAAILAVLTLAFRTRRRPGGRLVAAAAALLVASLLLWGALVAPVNAAWGDFAGAPRDAFVAAYERLRTRWEFGHLAAFIAWAAGWLALVAAASRGPEREDDVDSARARSTTGEQSQSRGERDAIHDHPESHPQHRGGRDAQHRTA